MLSALYLGVFLVLLRPVSPASFLKALVIYISSRVQHCRHELSNSSNTKIVEQITVGAAEAIQEPRMQGRQEEPREAQQSLNPQYQVSSGLSLLHPVETVETTITDLMLLSFPRLVPPCTNKRQYM